MRIDGKLVAADIPSEHMVVGPILDKLELEEIGQIGCQLHDLLTVEQPNLDPNASSQSLEVS